ncbi:hypothetical protein FF2_024557 [Malus domestica]
MQSKNEESDKDIIETFRNVQVNIPLLDTIKQIPKKLPPKCKDPGSFTIPYVIGNTRFEHAMLDLGASINVKPYSIYASMNLRELKNDGVIIQLADRSNAYPKRVLEDVLVQVDHLVFPTDFYVLEMEDSGHSSPFPILLGRPFMKTVQTKIDVAKRALTMEFGGDMIKFNVSDSVKNPNDVPNRIQAGQDTYINFRKLNATIRKDHYPLPFIDPMHGNFEDHVVEEIPLYAVGSNEA